MDDLNSLGLRTRAGKVHILDQQRLPQELVWLNIETTDDMVRAIVDLKVRGAPLIGVAAALWLGRLAEGGCSQQSWLEQAQQLRAARPTAVNLAWAVDRLVAVSEPWNPAQINALAITVFNEDVEQCHRIGEIGADLIQDGDSVMTHCNAGALATAGIGTAVGVLAAAKARGQLFSVIAGETRPLLQGARLTAWELRQLDIPHRLICDSAAAFMMSRGEVDKIVVGADRIAANGDVANKIGTYALAVAASHHGIPFYVAAPWSTVDITAAGGADIPIEWREQEEVLGAAGSFGNVRWAVPGSEAANPAFDITPAALITGWIFEHGLFLDPAEIVAPQSGGVVGP